jgi:hypothetical protein
VYCRIYEYSFPQIIKIDKGVHLYPVLLHKKPEAVNDIIFVIVLFQQGLPFKYGGSKELWVIHGKQWHEPNEINSSSCSLPLSWWSKDTTTAGGQY